jgi:hypothetical protein
MNTSITKPNPAGDANSDARPVKDVIEPAKTVLAPRSNEARKPQKPRLPCFGFQIEIKENKTPGDEHYLDPPGAEFASLV